MTRLILVAALIACGDPSIINPPPTDLTPLDAESSAAPARLSVTPDGTIRDRLMSGQACAWALDAKCVKRCFPLEPMWPACDGHGTRYYYTRQGLFNREPFGRVDTMANPACRGQITSWLIEIVPLNSYDVAHVYKPQSCDGRYDFSQNILDRQWYRYQQAEFEAAGVEALTP